jgi:hypothetical protein
MCTPVPDGPRLLRLLRSTDYERPCWRMMDSLVANVNLLHMVSSITITHFLLRAKAKDETKPQLNETTKKKSLTSLKSEWPALR